MINQPQQAHLHPQRMQNLRGFINPYLRNKSVICIHLSRRNHQPSSKEHSFPIYYSHTGVLQKRAGFIFVCSKFHFRTAPRALFALYGPRESVYFLGTLLEASQRQPRPRGVPDPLPGNDGCGEAALSSVVLKPKQLAAPKTSSTKN